MPWLADLKIETKEKNQELLDLGKIDKQEFNRRTAANRKDKGRENNKFKQEKLFDKNQKPSSQPIQVESTLSASTSQDKDEIKTLD